MFENKNFYLWKPNSLETVCESSPLHWKYYTEWIQNPEPDKVIGSVEDLNLPEYDTAALYNSGTAKAVDDIKWIILQLELLWFEVPTLWIGKYNPLMNNGNLLATLRF